MSAEAMTVLVRYGGVTVLGNALGLAFQHHVVGLGQLLCALLLL